MADGTMWLMRQEHHGRPVLQPLSGPLPPPTARKGLPTAQPLREARSPKPPPVSFARAETSPKPWHQPVRGRGIRVETRTSPDRRVCLCQNPPSTGCRQNRRRHACSLVHKHQVHSPSAGPVASPMPIRACYRADRPRSGGSRRAQLRLRAVALGKRPRGRGDGDAAGPPAGCLVHNRDRPRGAVGGVLWSPGGAEARSPSFGHRRPKAQPPAQPLPSVRACAAARDAAQPPRRARSWGLPGWRWWLWRRWCPLALIAGEEGG